MSTQMPSRTPLVGFRFSPTDEELVDHFLMRKLQHNAVEDNAVIPEIKLCDYEPWELPDKIKKDSSFQAQHFFSTCDYKYKDSLRINRVTETGFWKPTGQPRKVINKSTKRVIGTKKSLVFYQKHKPNPKRTGFILHEYEATAKPEGESKFRLYKLKFDWDEKFVDGESDGTASSSCSSSENQIPAIDLEYQNGGNQSGVMAMKGNATATKLGYNSQNMYGDIDASTLEDGSHVNEGSVACFDQLEPLVGPEDSFYSELWSPS